MKNKAVKALIEMGMPADILGFHYIIEAIDILAATPDDFPKTTWLYAEIARLHMSTPSKVERCIRHAFEVVTLKGDLEIVNKWLTMQNPTNGNLLHTFYLRLSMEG